MKCPFCSNRLRQVKSRSAIVDICPDCRGIWFDSGELADFVRALTESEEISPEIPRLFEHREVHTLDTVKEKDKICSRCNQVMLKFNYSYDSNVFLDKCPQCGGIWADGGEVQQIASYLKDDPRIVEIGRHLAKHARRVEGIKEFGGLGKMFTRRISPAIFFMPKIIIPLSDDTPRERFPFLSTSIISLCTLIFISQMLFVVNPGSFVESLGFVPANFFSMGLITSMFLHGGLLHLIGNMFFLWLFGDNVEDRFSRFGYLVFYLFCGLAASILHSVFNWDSSIPAIGASGAISGIMGAYLVFYPSAELKVLFWYRIVEIQAYLYLGGWFLFQLVFGLLHQSVGHSNIAWFAHIGGFIFGAIVAFFKKKAQANI